MTFEELFMNWDGKKMDFIQDHSRSARRHWSIAVESNWVKTSWGQFGGAMQQAVETFSRVNVGKKNEMSAQAYALDRAKELCRKKHWEGYRCVNIEGTNVIELEAPSPSEINFDKLPLNLSFYKPDNTMGAGIAKKAERGQVWYSRKRNGMMHLVCKGSGRAQIYSRRMLRQHDDEAGTNKTWDMRFGHIIERLNPLMPPNSILLGEMILDRGGKDDFKAIQSYTKSLTEQSMLDQQQNGWASFYIWDVAFWNGVDLVRNAPIEDRYKLIHELELQDSYTLPVEVIPAAHFSGPYAAVEHAKKMDWEGFVVVVPGAIYGDKGYNFKGKPDRPGTACAKLKPEFELDAVAIWDPDKGYGERSQKERYNQGIKSVALFQYDSNGKLIFLSNVSSGLTEDMKTNLADPKLFPRCWKILYSDRRFVSQGDDTNALDFARFDSERTDKRIEECIEPMLDITGG